MNERLKALAKTCGTTIGKAPQQLFGALDEWLNFLWEPQTPPFSNGTYFTGEWKRFFRVLAVSISLAAALIGVDRYVPGGAGQLPAIPVPILYKVIGIFALAAILYSLCAKAFGISIRVRQSFFCMAFVLIPWLPVLAAVKIAGARLGFFFLFIASNVLVVYILLLLAKGIRIVANTSLLRAALSLLPGILIVVVSVIWYVGSR